jgi:hypothetical protein
METGMRNAGDMLWLINNEYRKRLTQAENLLSLLEQLILTHNGDRQRYALDVLAYVREQLRTIHEEHRHWRYSSYYESAESKRMVHDDQAVQQALSRFSRMRAQQGRRLSEIYALLYDTPRPDPSITRVPNGDLWTMTQFALDKLVTFDDDVMLQL